MAIHTRAAIESRMAAGAIVISPAPEVIGPNSVDLHLGDTLKTYASGELDALDPLALPALEALALEPIGVQRTCPCASCRAKRALAEPERLGWYLTPGRVYLGVTREYTETRDLVPYLDGRSSLGRLGVLPTDYGGRYQGDREPVGSRGGDGGWK